ncbi:MAG: hypothetical protein NTX64_15695 [Elusimicrobia bacterium]|nr:hypothetical protein [Elusimicrobiota bacterium]
MNGWTNAIGTHRVGWGGCAVRGEVIVVLLVLAVVVFCCAAYCEKKGCPICKVFFKSDR